MDSTSAGEKGNPLKRYLIEFFDLSGMVRNLTRHRELIQTMTWRDFLWPATVVPSEGCSGLVSASRDDGYLYRRFFPFPQDSVFYGCQSFTFLSLPSLRPPALERLQRGDVSVQGYHSIKRQPGEKGGFPSRDFAHKRSFDCIDSANNRISPIGPIGLGGNPQSILDLTACPCHSNSPIVIVHWDELDCSKPDGLFARYGAIISLVLGIWFFLTPVFYPEDVIAPAASILFQLKPDGPFG